jgi:hypothetical protein
MNKIENLKQELIRTIKKIEDNNWVKANIIIHFPPFTNKGFTTLPSFFDGGNSKVRLIPRFDQDFTGILFDFIKEVNTNDTFNELTFFTKKDDYENATINVSFNPEIEKDFQSSLPKSKRGKTIPWWKLEQL